MAKIGANEYYNLLISRLNTLIDGQVELYSDKQITPDININYITGRVKGFKVAIEVMEELANQLHKQEITFKDTGHAVKLIDGDKTIPMPHEIRKDFKYE